MVTWDIGTNSGDSGTGRPGRWGRRTRLQEARVPGLGLPVAPCPDPRSLIWTGDTPARAVAIRCGFDCTSFSAAPVVGGSGGRAPRSRGIVAATVAYGQPWVGPRPA